MARPLIVKEMVTDWADTASCLGAQLLPIHRYLQFYALCIMHNCYALCIAHLTVLVNQVVINKKR